MTKKWQQLWDQNTHKKLHQMQTILKKQKRKLDPNMTKEETALPRLCIGHTKLTYSFILKEEPLPRGFWENQYTVKHFD